MTSARRAILASALTALGAPLASAQGIDMSHGGPIEVTARGGLEWRQNQQVVIAEGDARAVRGDVTILADKLIAHYRKKAGAPAATPASANAGSMLGGDAGSNELYRLEAVGHVRIANPTDIAVGDHAVYDLDQAVLVMTGNNMSLTTPSDVLTARDTMEYWAQKHLAVGRGDATVTTSDGRRISADVLAAYTKSGPATPGATPAAKPDKPGQADPLAGSGKLERVEAFGHVKAQTADETMTGDRGVYVADTGIARLVGNVEVTRGLNHVVGDEALMNMKTGVYNMIRTPGRRVEGVIIPSDASTQDAKSAKPVKK